MDERQLIDGVLSGDPTAERLFYDRHLDRVWRLAYRLTGDGDLAQDVVQETSRMRTTWPSRAVTRSPT